ncbi:MAG: HDOD domain-containing protein [Planctomycetota bacterium]
MPSEVVEKLRRKIETIGGLPTLPTMLAKINQFMINPRTTAKEVGQLIASDPALTIKILRIVNSSFYGFPNRITTTTHAIVILGFNAVKGVILSTSVFDAFGKDGKSASFDRLALWKHSVACGAASRVLARRIGVNAIEEFFVAGLLHDIGKVILDQCVPEEFGQAIRRAKEADTLLLEAESEVLGVSHAEVGSWLLERWNLPRIHITAVARHHNPALADDELRLTPVVHLADVLVRSICIGNGGDRRIPAISPDAWKSTGLSADDFPALLQEVHDEAERAMVFLEGM